MQPVVLVLVSDFERLAKELLGVSDTHTFGIDDQVPYERHLL